MPTTEVDRLKREWREAVERVWEAFADRDYTEPSISPKELHAVLETVLAEERPYSNDKGLPATIRTEG